ncbi:MAG TPA: ATP-binding protein, partial [Candidatus Kryptobacter bacterium]|nr:ATP-binding protein [Candidatus Kryptobacter bacterium]
VEDEGGGFNPDSIPDPLLPENLLKPSGRGIHIIRSLMDQVDFEFTSRGTKVIMRLKIGELA